MSETTQTPVNDGGAAFPIADAMYPNGQVQPGSPGMSLRDYFAAKAMQGLCANLELANRRPDDLARYSVQKADALITELRKK